MNNTVNGFHHIAIKVADFDKVVAFYTEGLGFTVTMAWGEGDSRAVMVDTGKGNHIEIFAGGKKYDTDDGAYLHLAISTTDCDENFKRALAAGAIPTKEPTEVVIQSNPPKPVRLAFCKGLNGEILEFFQEK